MSSSAARQRKKSSNKSESTSVADLTAAEQTRNKTESPPPEIVEKTNDSAEPSSNRLARWLFDVEDASWLAALRILWGLLVAVDIYGFIQNDFARTRAYFFSSKLRFAFSDWSRVPLMPFDQMRHLLFFLQLLSVSLVVGYRSRLSALMLSIGLTYIFLLDMTYYTNHVYLMILVLVMLTLTPCGSLYSLDSLRSASVRSHTVPKWYRKWIRLQLLIVYVYAGLSKLNEDWLRAEPLRHWLHTRPSAIAEWPLLGQWLKYESAAYVFTYGTLAFELLAPILLLNRTTLWPAIVLSLLVHLFDRFVLSIGVMCWLLLTLTTLFLSADWPKRLLHSVTFGRFAQSTGDAEQKSSGTQQHSTSTGTQQALLLLAVLFLAIQIAVPLRQYQHEGSVLWHDNGQLFSWNMKTADKACVASVFAFHKATDQLFAIPVDKLLTRRQAEMLATRPQMILQMADFVAQHLHYNGTPSEVYFYSLCQLNFRVRQLLVNPKVNLASEEAHQWPYSWVTGLIQLPTFAQEQYPWNWEWNFNWLRLNDTDNSDFARAGIKSFKSAQENEPRRQWAEFVNNIIATHYGNDKALLTNKQPIIAEL